MERHGDYLIDRELLAKLADEARRWASDEGKEDERCRERRSWTG